MALYLLTGLEPVPRCEPIPTSPLADDIATELSGPVRNNVMNISFNYFVCNTG